MTYIRYMLDQEDETLLHKLVYVQDGERTTLCRFEMIPGTSAALGFMVDMANEGLRGRGFSHGPHPDAVEENQRLPQ